MQKLELLRIAEAGRRAQEQLNMMGYFGAPSAFLPDPAASFSPTSQIPGLGCSGAPGPSLPDPVATATFLPTSQMPDCKSHHAGTGAARTLEPSPNSMQLNALTPFDTELELRSQTLARRAMPILPPPSTQNFTPSLPASASVADPRSMQTLDASNILAPFVIGGFAAEHASVPLPRDVLDAGQAKLELFAPTPNLGHAAALLAKNIAKDAHRASRTQNRPSKVARSGCQKSARAKRTKLTRRHAEKAAKAAVQDNLLHGDAVTRRHELKK